MIDIIASATFTAWLASLRDRAGRSRILVRIDRLAAGNPGDVKPVGGGISELRIAAGPGYRVYFMHHDHALIILLCGGDKSSQAADIAAAKRIAADWKPTP
jgi:putative addiction module killer protein